MRRLGRRTPVTGPVPSVSSPSTLPSPRNGWFTSANLSETPPATAQVMDNWFPTTTGVKLRGGSRTIATIGATPVISFIAYNKGVSKKLFACSSTAIYDVTSVADPNAAPAASVSGLTAGYWVYSNFTTSGGAYLVAANGADAMRLYDGTTWSTATITFPAGPYTATTSQMSSVWTYRQRMFMTKKGTLVAYYLAIDSIGGSAFSIVLDGVLDRGGSLLFGATWSQSSSEGLDENCVFVSDQGQVAVYQGADPGGSSWNLVGVYNIAPPLGPRAWMKVGGELVIATEEGLTPLSAAVTRDTSSLALAALSVAIEPEWRTEVLRRRPLPWEIVKWARQKYAIVSLPITQTGQEPWVFVRNTETGAWCRYTGWDVRCMDILNEQVYFGTSDGKVKQAEIGGSDDGGLIYYTLVFNPDPLGLPGQYKTVRQARPTFRSATPFDSKVSFSTNYTVTLPTPPNAVASPASNEWDSGLWDVAKWDQAAASASVQTRWVSIGRSGYTFQAQVQVTGGINQLPNTELVQIDCMSEAGGIVV